MYKRIDDLEQALKDSHDKPLLILKHSPTCHISAGGKSEVDKFVEKNADTDVHLLIVQEQRPLSNELAQKLAVKHESPQLLLIKDGKAQKVLNHSDIQQAEIEKVLAG